MSPIAYSIPRKALWAAGSVSLLFLGTACDPSVGGGPEPSGPTIEITVPDAGETATTDAETTTTAAETTTTAAETTTTAAETTTAAPEVTEPPKEPVIPIEERVPPTPFDPEETPPSGSSSFEQEVVTLTNAERAKANCPPLTANARLNAAAQAHSRDMVNQDYFDHTGLNSSSPGDRISVQGYSFRGWAENIAKGQRTPEGVVTAWMNSAGHRRNILNCQLTEIGVGEHQRAWTQVFGTPR